MGIKPQTVIPAGFKVTRCPPGSANATPLWVLRKQEEQAIEAGFNTYREWQAFLTENQTERRNEIFGAARLNGASISDALDEGK